MKKIKQNHQNFNIIIFVILFISVFYIQLTYSQTGDTINTTTNITQYNITWYFSEPVQYGQFANGDYWVIGPVTITNITPEFNGINHGWEVNPGYSGPQGFDIGAIDFDTNLVPSLPYTASGGESILKMISLNPGSSSPCYPACIQTAAVLTVVSEVPPDNGLTVFRPPYVGTDKPYYYVDDLRLDLLPSYSSAGITNARPLTWVEYKFHRVQVEHQTARNGRVLRPIENYEDGYGAYVGRYAAEGALALMLDYDVNDKMNALIYYIQGGIDRYHAMLLGQWWPSGDGHSPGMKLPLAFTAVMFDNQTMKDNIANTVFYTDGRILVSGINGMALYGDMGRFRGEENYWDYCLVNYPGYNLEDPDPYHYIDGSSPLHNGYQHGINSPVWKACVIAMHLMPRMKPIWNNNLTFDYVDRWVNIGVWTQPDPCAPHDDNWDNYGITYGTDSSGGCILDTVSSDSIGRLVDLHGLYRDCEGVDTPYDSDFASEMWNAYRGASCYNGVCEAGETAETCPYDCGKTTYIDSEIVSNNKATFSIYPNPASSVLFIESDNESEVLFELFNLSGIKVLQQKINTNKQTINISGLSEGVYLFKIYNDNSQLKYGKLLINR